MENIRSTIEIGNNLCDLTGPWVEYHNNLDTNMETLKRKTKQLNRRNNDINVEVNYAEKWSGKKRRVEVELWQEYVRRITADVQTLERQEQEVRGLNNAFKCAQWRQRVVDKIEEVKKLYEMGEFSNGLLIDDPTRGHAIPTASLAEPTSVRNRKKIWNFLMDDAVRKIGVHGMGGVGKTIIMKSINNQLMKSMNNQLLSRYYTFSDVIWVTVSEASDIKNLQGKIAKELKIDLSNNEDELRSASEINKMLSQKKRYVLILDDLWKEFPLEKIGIPEPTRDNGCKLVLTTRLVDVCTKMNCRPIEMELLTEEEALNLFMNYVKEHQTMLATEPEEIAKEVAKKCARLPLAIVVMAGHMRRLNDIREWRNARNVQLRPDKERFFEQLKFCYSQIKDEQERHCFLYCALYLEDHDIDREELIAYWIAEELISEMNSIEAMFDKGHSILNKLIESSWLVRSITYGRECVKMHDLIRDMALEIISASPQFMVRPGEGLKRVPHKDWSGDLERVSLMLNQCHIEELPSEPPNCPYLGGKQDKDKACLRDTSVDSASCSDTSNDDKDDDSFLMNMEPLYSISPNGSFKRNIKSWQKGECLGRGSFGTVYEAFTDDGFFFAAKEASSLDQGGESILQEISLLSQFEHENIVQYLGTDKVDSKLYIFLELVTKGSLVSLYQKYQLRDPQVSQYTRQILNGLNYLHSQNVVHRDIKCANILVDASGSVKLADFGLAKATTLNDIKSCKGTARWMAPEVVKQDGYGLAADIWSLGCTVLEMLTCKFPYSRLEEMAALFRIGNGELPHIPNSLSSDAQDFIFRCLKVNPNDRPTAAELLNHPFVNFDQPLATEDVRF